MRIAVIYEIYENGEVFQHFGHTEQFKLYDVADGRIVGEQTVGTNCSGHGALAGFLKAAQTDALICGGIGMGAREALAEAGIKLNAGATSSADAAARALAEGTLAYDPNASCGHHDRHGEGHGCGHIIPTMARGTNAAITAARRRTAATRRATRATAGITASSNIINRRRV